jgi:hypothetical protein
MSIEILSSNIYYFLHFYKHFSICSYFKMQKENIINFLLTSGFNALTYEQKNVRCYMEFMLLKITISQ